MEMTTWFDTNYHYILPRAFPRHVVRRRSDKPLAELREANALGIRTRPVLVAPVSFPLLGKLHGGSPVTLLDRLLPVYEELLGALGREGAEWVQLDEPCLVTDLDEPAKAAFRTAYERLSKVSVAPRTLLTTVTSTSAVSSPWRRLSNG